MKRRDFFKKTAILASVTGFSHSAGGLSVTMGDDSPNKTAGSGLSPDSNFPGKSGPTLTSNWGDEPVEHLTAYYPDFADKNVWIRKDNQILTVYRAGANQKYPYFYPLIGPASRVSVTSESAQPWPHHRSVFLGLDRVNGGNYWQQGNEQGQILSQGAKIQRATEDCVEFTDSCLWKKPGEEPIIEDNRRYVLTWKTKNYYTLDLYYRMISLVDVEVQKTNHGFFGVRAEQDLAPIAGGKMRSSEGGTSEVETLGKPAKWIAFYGQRRFNRAITEGVAVLAPPEPFEPFEKCPWFTRDYGNISPMPFNFVETGHVFRYPKGHQLEKVYRTVVFVGTPDDIDLDALWKEIYE